MIEHEQPSAVFSLQMKFYSSRLTTVAYFQVSTAIVASINRPGGLFNSGSMRVSTYSRWALIRGWALIIFPTFSASKDILENNDQG